MTLSRKGITEDLSSSYEAKVRLRISFLLKLKHFYHGHALVKNGTQATRKLQRLVLPDKIINQQEYTEKLKDYSTMS